MATEIVKSLSSSDKNLLSGFRDIQYEEPEQIIQELPQPEESPPETSRKHLSSVRDLADVVLGRIDALKSKVDEKGKRFKISTNQPAGSTLYQAMYRVFGERTTEVTYEHYKRALELRTQMSKEDAAILRVK